MALQCGQCRTGVLERDGRRRRDGASHRRCRMNRMRTDKGFSFIEVTIAVALMGILAVISLSSMKTYLARRDMLQGARQLAGDLRLTQQYAMTYKEQDRSFRLAYSPTSTSSYTIRKVKDSDGSVISTLK